MRLSRSHVAAALICALAAIAVWTTALVFSGSRGGMGTLPRSPSLIGAVQGGEAPHEMTAPRHPEQSRDRLLVNGSLAGTEPAGDWCVNTLHQIRPCNALRLRFEYYLLGIGELQASELRSLVQDESRRVNGAALTREIMAVWDRYWQLRTYAFRNRIDPLDRSTWLPVVEELHAVRQQLLGPAWASAFFADDEAAFRADYARLEAGLPRPADMGDPVPQLGAGADAAAVTAARVSQFGKAAAERLAQVDAEWSDWQERMSLARAEWTRLQQAANLSASQRQTEMNRYVQGHFSAQEQRRVSALLNL